jgi:23S rRNA (guanosine2251-2'-O)-methyltransferase
MRRHAKPKSRPNFRAQVANDDIVFGLHAVKASLEFMPQRARKLMFESDSSNLSSLIAAARELGISTEQVQKHTLTDLCGGDAAHQGVALSVRSFPYQELEDVLPEQPTLCLVLDGVQDPRNLGRAARSAFAMGADFLIIPKDRSAPVTGAAEKAATGALARLPVVRATNLARTLEELKTHNFWIVGAEAHASKWVWDWDFSTKTALVVGGEDSGVRPLVQATCDAMLSIPMDAESFSLNAADAAVLLLYEARKQRFGLAKNKS